VPYVIYLNVRTPFLLEDMCHALRPTLCRHDETGWCIFYLIHRLMIIEKRDSIICFFLENIRLELRTIIEYFVLIVCTYKVIDVQLSKSPSKS